MATERATPPEGFEKAQAPSTNNDYDTEWLNRPELGEMVQGTLLAAKPNCGQYDSTVLEIRLTQPFEDFEADSLISMWSTNGIDAALEESNVQRGDEIAIVCDETFETEDDDGETVERRSFAVYVQN